MNLEVDPESLCLNPDNIESAITPQLPLFLRPGLWAFSYVWVEVANEQARWS